MKKLALCGLLALLAGCSTGDNVRVLESNPPWCQDYILHDDETGADFMRYNSPQGNESRQIIPVKK